MLHSAPYQRNEFRQRPIDATVQQLGSATTMLLPIGSGVELTQKRAKDAL